MTRAQLIAGVLSVSLLVSASPVIAQDVTTESCVTEMYASLQKEQLFYRSVLFGQLEATKLPRSAVRYDGSVQPWIKTGDNQWKTYAKGFENTTWSNSLMDTQGFPPKRRGLLEAKKALTSESLPMILQAFRAFQCRLRAVCKATLDSRNAGTDDLKIEIDGCIAINLKPLNACRDAQVTPTSTVEVGQINVQVGVCDQAAQGIVDREADVLSLVVAYDASYRSFLQFAGIMQEFSNALRAPVLDVLTNMVQNLQHFGDVPCFSGQCDE